MRAGSLVLTQLSVHGSYFPDIFAGLLLCGLGIGLAFVTATVAALAGVAKREAGLASGLSNTALQIGTALGVAIVTTVAVSRSQHYLAAHKGANPLAALTDGSPCWPLPPSAGGQAASSGVMTASALRVPPAWSGTHHRRRKAGRWSHPSPRPGHNQGTIPRTRQGATGADRGDSERIGASQNSPHEGAVPWAVRNSRNTRTSTPT